MNKEEEEEEEKDEKKEGGKKEKEDEEELERQQCVYSHLSVGRAYPVSRLETQVGRLSATS